jgi:hypothetical protein
MPLVPFSEPTERMVQLLQERQPLLLPGRDRVAVPRRISPGHGNEPLSRARLHEIVDGAFSDHQRSLPQWGSASASLSILLAAIRVPDMARGVYTEVMTPGGEPAWRLADAGDGITGDERGDESPGAAVLICGNLRHPGLSTPRTRYGSLLVLAGALAEAIYQRARRHGLAAHVNMAPAIGAAGAARRVRRSLRHLVTVEVDRIEPGK